nr:hypothetical protein [Thioflavicoccus mobilis]
MPSEVASDDIAVGADLLDQEIAFATVLQSKFVLDLLILANRPEDD